MYRTYSYNDMPKPIIRQREEEKKPLPPPKAEKKHPQKCEEKKCGLLDGILGNMEADDIILLIVVLSLIIDDCDDKLLLIALGFVFISEWL